MMTVKGARRRRDERYKTKIPVSLTIGRNRIEAYTEDVSFRGLFVRTDQSAALNQLLVVETQLPSDPRSFKSHGMAVFLIGHEEDGARAPGIGIQFYAMGPARLQWEKYTI